MASHPPAPADSSRLDELVRRYSAEIRAIVSRAGEGAIDAAGEDFEQRVLTDLRREIGHEKAIQHPASYVFRAAVRATVRLLGRPPADESTGPTAAQVALQKAIAGLDGDRRRAVQAHLAGYEVEEIMQMFDWTYKRTRNLLGHGMTTVHHQLKIERLHGD